MYGEELADMTTAYELWEMTTGNLMDSFESQEEALSVVADAIRTYGPSYVDSIMLVLGSGDESRKIASGRELADWATKPVPGPSSTQE
jgi:hypothetical protein